MAYPTQSARFADILLAVKNRLVVNLPALLNGPGLTIIDPSRIILVKGGGYRVKFVAERHVRVRAVRGLYFGDAGAARTAMYVTRTIAVDVFTRSALDPAGEDDAALTEELHGHYDLEEAVADSLVLWMPATAPLVGDPAPLTIEPLHPAEVPQDADAPDDERYEGYLCSTVYFDCRYEAKLSQ